MTGPNETSNAALDLAARMTVSMGAAGGLPLRPEDADLLDSAEPFRFCGDTRQGWSVGDGPVVCLVHGFGGLGVQMMPLAQHLAAQGFRAVFFDAGGHGASYPGRIGFDTFIDDTAALCDAIGPEVHALVGHSAGGLAMMRARQVHGVRASCYGVIAAPLFPYVPLDRMRGQGAPEEALDHVKAVLSDQFRISWSALAAGESFLPDGDAPMLAVYDTADDRVRHSDAERIATLWPGTRIVKTAGQGHNRVLRAAETLAAVADFVSGTAAG